MSEISSITGVHCSTIGKIKEKITQKMNTYFEINPIRLGGPGIFVQIDETMLNHKVMSRRDRSPAIKIWALTMVEANQIPGKFYAQIMPSRKAEIIIPIIYNIVRPSSIIITDESRAYNQLSANSEFTHLKITHKNHFANPDAGIHTQNVESLNNKLKLLLKKQKVCKSEDREKMIPYFYFWIHLKGKVLKKSRVNNI